MRLLRNKSGSMLILLMVIMFVLFSSSMILGEVLRLHGLHSHVEYELQRAVNIALEEAMRDSWRQDKLNKLDEERARDNFYYYLTHDLGLNGAYQMIRDGQVVYRLEFERVETTEDPPRLEVSGQALVRSAFPFLVNEMETPFEIRSKNFRMDE